MFVYVCLEYIHANVDITVFVVTQRGLFKLTAVYLHECVCESFSKRFLSIPLLCYYKTMSALASASTLKVYLRIVHLFLSHSRITSAILVLLAS